MQSSVLRKTEKLIVPTTRTSYDASFEWSPLRIPSTVSKITIITLYSMIKSTAVKYFSVKRHNQSGKNKGRLESIPWWTQKLEPICTS